MIRFVHSHEIAASRNSFRQLKKHFEHLGFSALTYVCYCSSLSDWLTTTGLISRVASCSWLLQIGNGGGGGGTSAREAEQYTRGSSWGICTRSFQYRHHFKTDCLGDNRQRDLETRRFSFGHHHCYARGVCTPTLCRCRLGLACWCVTPC
jgi:hypothetical protein